jgi:hypothetical protein
MVASAQDTESKEKLVDDLLNGNIERVNPDLPLTHQTRQRNSLVFQNVISYRANSQETHFTKVLDLWRKVRSYLTIFFVDLGN